jgi:geranylgeranyl pyrophosphate synthase
MNIYRSTLEYLFTLPVISAWPEVVSLLENTAAKMPRDWRLPVMACEAVGGMDEQAIPASAAIACAQASLILIDDMLDDDPRGIYWQLGPGRAANMACVLQAASLEIFLPSLTSLTIKEASRSYLNRMFLATALGQDLDVHNPPDEKAYWEIVKYKSAPFFGTALQLGALLGGASEKVAAGLERYGRLYGEMIQIHDDLSDTMAIPANPDWIVGRSPLPILFAKTVDHPARDRFLELCQEITCPDALTEAQNILISCGAVSYCMHHLMIRHTAAQQILASLSLPDRDALNELTEAAIFPVLGLFEAIGEKPSELLSEVANQK